MVHFVRDVIGYLELGRIAVHALAECEQLSGIGEVRMIGKAKENNKQGVG